MKTIIEPFKIKSVEPIEFTTVAEREAVLKGAWYNLFLVHADRVLIDLLTDSGTAAMSARQWAGMMEGDESYAGARSFYRFESKVKELTGFSQIIPTHQGRAAEKILFSLVGGKGKFVPNNSHFDTTRANVEFSGAEAVDLPTEAGKDPDLIADFKGNMDTEALATVHREGREGSGASLHDYGHQQLGRRSTGVHGEYPRDESDLRSVRNSPLPRRVPVCRERLLHQEKRARVRRCAGEIDRS
jgi:tryptophanase